MSVLLRCPAAVPALFSHGVETELPAFLPVTLWERLRSSAPLLVTTGWAAAMLIDMPLVKAATVAAGFVLPG